MRAAMAVNSGAVVSFFDWVGGGAGDRCPKRMKIWFHEPGQGFKVHELDC